MCHLDETGQVLLGPAAEALGQQVLLLRLVRVTVRVRVRVRVRVLGC